MKTINIIKNLIQIVESRQIYEENIPTSIPTTKSSTIGTVAKGAAVAGGLGLLGSYVLGNNPELMDQMKQGGSSLLKNAKDTAQSVAQTATEKAEQIKLDNEFKSHMGLNPSNMSGAEIDSHMKYIVNKAKDFTKLPPDQQDSLNKSYMKYFTQLKSLENSGRADSNLSKAYDPKLFSQIQTDEEKLQMDKASGTWGPKAKFNQIRDNTGNAINSGVNAVTGVFK